MSAANAEADASTGLLDSDAALKPFLDILNDSSSNRNLSTVRSLTLKILAHPQIFCGFDEFKSRCQVQDGSASSLINTLDLFSYGTLKDYYANQETNKDFYLPLNEPALAKLGQLTVLTCIQEACLNGETSISYDTLAESLGSMQDESIRDMEDVLIQCLYSNVLKGKLCQKNRSFGWTGERLPVVLSRDVAPSSLSGLLSALEGLGQRLEESQTSVAETQEQVMGNLQQTADYWKASLQDKKKDLDEKGGSSSRLFAGARQVLGSASASTAINPRRSSKRSRGGMAGSFMADASGYRM